MFTLIAVMMLSSPVQSFMMPGLTHSECLEAMGIVARYTPHDQIAMLFCMAGKGVEI